MTKETVNSILNEYEEKSNLYSEYGKKLELLIKEFLIDEKIHFHSVSNRKKDIESLERKINKPEQSYKKLEDITDLCGLRIITYFSDDVERVSKIIEREFNIDSENSSNKADLLDPDRFGYLSVHYIASNNQDRSNLTEYKKYNKIKAEIQIRSILQHAWAEIEHDLGYKSLISVPKTVQRQFSRLAGLLELADQEFRTIRERIFSYSNEVLTDIQSDPENVNLDAISLSTLILNDDPIKKIDEAIAKTIGVKIKSNDNLNSKFSRDVERLYFFNIKTINELKNIINKNKNEIIEFANLWLKRRERHGTKNFSPGITIFYLCYILAIKDTENDKIEKYVTKFITKTQEKSHKDLANALKEEYSKLQKNPKTL